MFLKRSILPGAALSLLGGLLVSRAALADSVTAASGTGPGVEFKNVTIDKIEDNQIYYKTQAGTAVVKAVNDKLRLNLTDEPGLTAAETAFAEGKFADAVDGYQKTVRSTNKPWLKELAALRLEISAEKAKRFDAAVLGYIALLELNPKSAADHKPKLPDDPNSAYLRMADAALDSAAKSEKDQGKALSLLAFDLDIARALKDDAKVATIAKKLTDSAGSGATAVGVDPRVASAALEGQLSLLKVQVDKGDYAASQKLLAQLKPTIVDPAQQADWLWFNAETQFGAAKDSKDATVLKNAALEYVRFVANCPADPRVGQALLKTAELHEKFNDPRTALLLDEQVARDFAKNPEGAKAKQNVDRLQAGNK